MKGNSKNDKRFSNYCILNKIRHKPLLLESIFSFSSKKPYIIILLIQKDEALNIFYNKFFSNIKKNNDLSSELNFNIKSYQTYSNFYDNLKNDFSEKNENKIIENKLLRINLNKIMYGLFLNNKEKKNLLIKK